MFTSLKLNVDNKGSNRIRKIRSNTPKSLLHRRMIQI
jgi:hypothetical protein